MIGTVFNIVIHNPLYNGLVFLLNVIPGADVGVAIVALTIFVKILLLPLAKKAIHTQVALKNMGPQLEEIKKKYKDDQQEQVKRTLTLYKEHNVHPLSGIVVLFIQLPIILGLYWIFFRGGLPSIDMESLYSFVKAPEMVSMSFLGLIDMGGKSIVLAVLAGATQFVHAHIAIQPPTSSGKNTGSFKDDLAKNMHIQMKYVLPVVIGIIAYTISAAVALYWTTSNIFTIAQEFIIRKRLARRDASQQNHTQ